MPSGCWTAISISSKKLARLQKAPDNNGSSMEGQSFDIINSASHLTSYDIVYTTQDDISWDNEK